jgi:hypothetical protein
MKALFAAVLLLILTACNPVLGPSAKPVSKSTTGEPLPYAPPPPPLADEGVACAADVRQCKHGSFVSRNPDSGCEFDPCPGETNK